MRTFNQVIDIIANIIGEFMDFIEWLLIENNTQGLKILMGWITLALVFALIEMWIRNYV